MAISECESTSWWQQFGAEVRRSDVRGVLIINSHWTELDDKIRVGTKVNPVVELGSLVPRESYDDFKPTISRSLAQRVITLLRAAGFSDVDEGPDADWADAPTTPSLWMFRDGTPPTTTVSLNARYDPIFHVRMGQALRSLRKEGILIIASGAMVHNIFRANHVPMLLNGDNLQKGRTPAKWATDFAQSIEDVITSNAGSELAGALVRMSQSPLYPSAHPTPDHFYPLLVLAGAFYDDEELYGRQTACTYEMKNLVNSQYMWGHLPKTEAPFASPVAAVQQ
ncbi:hypothetical protein CDV31_013517 [Fusarium ambrosium]|uniref:Extradiol ring-cleavage dioxygenase class III enzyme subunit B domain-containing protein n=1 Tax=Fusarium ambrosium TaxID=131363 RepID=A0A428T2T9_9HYPO|nr:hypothetical protein CDV31_013517 [Fusarium ambrosium]